MSTLLRKIRTRSQSAASAQATTLNNQRPPKKGEWVRVRLKPSDTLGNNKTHGWVSIKVSNIYRIESEVDLIIIAVVSLPYHKNVPSVP